ncbi:MAG: nicotinate (nicotinamide) nucleotide adenylyltransferase [Ruminococcaceae bacterium]|nr:nicotinate (nicotinamide) nucleotide adenylyltransferase [Oscillospiraceae bacterium]
MRKRLGIFGGTFSPPHLGHVAAARSFISELLLDELLIIPTFIPPHKEMHEIDPSHRLAMTSLAFSGIDKAKVSRYELDKKGVSYTFETLEHFASEDTDIFFLCGTDMFLTLTEWKKPERIFELATIALALREDAHEDLLLRVREAKERFEKDFSAKIILLENTPVEVSSSELRTLVNTGKDASSFLSPEVYSYIKENGLYK